MNKKSPTGFRLVPTSVTLNDLERRYISLALILHYFIEFHSFASRLVEDRLVFGQNWLTRQSHVRSLCDS